MTPNQYLSISKLTQRSKEICYSINSDLVKDLRMARFTNTLLRGTMGGVLTQAEIKGAAHCDPWRAPRVLVWDRYLYDCEAIVFWSVIFQNSSLCKFV